MDDNDYVCPLCCEELDISDRQFFPCKCGYQVCMWCWHRIRETESGLCPACRTPYGDDPHAFSAVDVEEVLKANKEKAAAEKRKAAAEAKAAAAEAGSDSETVNTATSGGVGPMALPKDRTQLANMRVIRRNLVYAVGLPPALGSDDALRKPEYFGQYGKISKIVVNRNNASGGDPRRASTSAYVTFVHKEDTLACILALDGFFIDSRNIRASYGTSKYCSAFIKNVRCNNPECTYLHSMGEAEDTFTKQEIQAGYVTSGRDVLARQQQIVAQALADGRTAGSRRKVGGGGPSGTGRHSSHPVFPAPSYDEPPRSSSVLVGVPPPGGPSGRSLSVGAGFSAAVSSGQVSGGKIVRASSMSSSPPTAGLAIGGLPALKTPTNRKSVTGLGALSSPAGGASISGAVIGAPSGATAASVVAGVHSVGGNNAPAPAPHTTLTPLTPLKRTTQTKVGVPKPTSLETLGGTSLSGLRTAPTQKATSLAIGTAPTSPSSSLGSSKNDFSSEPIGGTVIGGGAIGSRGGVGPLNGSSDSLAAGPFGGPGLPGEHRARMNLGGDVFSGDTRSNSLLSGGGDRWMGAGVAGDPIVGPKTTTHLGSLWETQHDGSGMSMLGGAAPIGGPQKSHGGVGSIGGAPIGTPMGASNSTNGSSALASMLGINLPSGSGTFQETSTLWGASNHGAAPVSSLGGQAAVGGSGLLGGIPTTRGVPVGGATIGGGRPFPGGNVPIGAPQPNHRPINGGNTNNTNDIALLQSLLPGVRITSDAAQPAVGGFGSAGGGNWNSGVGNWNGGGGLPQPVGAPTVSGGVIGGATAVAMPKKTQKEQNQPSIW